MAHSPELAAVVQEQMEHWQIPGVIVGTLIDGKQTLDAWGVASIHSPAPMTPDMLVRVASISKVFTATLAMILAEDGVVSLDEPIRAYLPDLKLADENAAQIITLRHLLSHGSGLHGDFFIDMGQGEDALANAIGRFHELRQVYQPDELWAYTNSGFHLAGRVLEVAGGEPFDVLMHERVFGPLGMERSCFFAHEILCWPHAVGHAPVAPGSREHRVAGQYYPRNRFAAGGVASNAEELLRFAAFHLSEGEGLISPESLQAMQQPQRPAGNWADHWGIGWDLRDIDGTTVIAHGGSINGFKSQLTVIPARKAAFVMLTNSDYGSYANALFEQWLLEHELGLTRPKPEPLEIDLGDVAGKYSHPDGEIFLTPAGANLELVQWVDWPGEAQRVAMPAEQLAPIGDDRFLVVEGDGSGSICEIIRFASGKPRFFRRHGRLYDRVENA